METQKNRERRRELEILMRGIMRDLYIDTMREREIEKARWIVLVCEYIFLRKGKKNEKNDKERKIEVEMADGERKVEMKLKLLKKNWN